MNVRCRGGTIVGLLTGERTDIRNDLAHGYPFDGFPQSGLLELVRDLIEYAYRDMIRMHTEMGIREGRHGRS
jgi:hypothetical protein